MSSRLVQLFFVGHLNFEDVKDVPGGRFVMAAAPLVGQIRSCPARMA